MSMDHLVQTIFNLSESNGNLDNLALKAINEFPKVLSKNRDTLYAALDSLSPEDHSLGYLSILHFLSKHDPIPSCDFVDLTRNFLIVCDYAQVLRSATQLSNVAYRLYTLLLNHNPLHAIKPLRRVINILQGSNPHLLTAVHSPLVLCCIKATCYHLALPVIEKPILEVDTSPGISLEAKDNLSYHYYAAIVFIAFKRRKEALECLQAAITAPSTSISAIQIACYKKFILLSLLVHGQLNPLPRFTSPYVFRHIAKMAPEYSEMVDAYAVDMERLQKVVEVHRAKFDEDENLGLVRQTISGLVRRNIRNLTNTYVTLSLENIAQNSGADSAQHTEVLIRSMIEKGEIFARIDQPNGMVSFLDAREEFASARAVADMDGQIREVMHYWKKVAEAEKQVTLDPAYLSTLLKVERKSSEFLNTQDTEDDVALAQSYE